MLEFITAKQLNEIAVNNIDIHLEKRTRCLTNLHRLRIKHYDLNGRSVNARWHGGIVRARLRGAQCINSHLEATVFRRNTGRRSLQLSFPFSLSLSRFPRTRIGRRVPQKRRDPEGASES